MTKAFEKIENWSREIKADKETLPLLGKEIGDYTRKYLILQMDICIDYLVFVYSYLDAV